ncbi:MAG: AAA family ATPase [Bulleidia sp.]
MIKRSFLDLDYRTAKETGCYIVDKSLLLRDLFEYHNRVTLITRHRRFGKTLNMSMMAEFFDIKKDSKAIFSDTKIMETEYASELNQWPVIHLTFSSAKEPCGQSALRLNQRF